MLRRHWLVGIFCASLGGSIGCQGNFETTPVNEDSASSNVPGSPSLRAFRFGIYGHRLTGPGGQSGGTSGAAGAVPVTGTGGATVSQSGGISGTPSPATGGTTGSQSGGVTGTGGSPPVPGTGGAVATATGGTTGGGTGGTPAVLPNSTTVAAVAAACANEAFPTTGTIHYVCDCGAGADANCVAGSDSNSGLSKALAWRTYNKGAVAVSSMSAGDTIAWCKGGSFAATADVLLASTSCSAGKPCLIRDYVPTWASGDEHAPKFVVSDGVVGFHFFNSGGAVHDEGYRVLNLDLEGPGRDSSAAGMAFGNDITDVTVCNLTANGFAVGIDVGGSSAPLSAGSDGKQARLTFQGNQFTNNGYGWEGTCNGCTVINNHFSGTGLTNTDNTHAIYVDDGYVTDYTVPYEVSGEVISNNLIENNENPAGHCNGIELVVHGQHANMTIAGNTVQEPAANVEGGCYGIAVMSGYGTPEHFTNVHITGNTIINPGQIGIYQQICANCTIENNLVLTNSINTYAITWGTPNGKHDPEDTDGTAGTVRNNTIYMSNAGQGGIGIYFGGEGKGHIIANNAIYSTSTGTTNGWACLSMKLAFSAYSFVDNNLCWFPNAKGGSWDATTADSLAAWQAASGFDKHSLNSAPAYVNAAMTGYDFSPAAGSPLIGAGSAANAPTTDFLNAARPSPPDIGAFQHR